jgi:hypothetical protein
MTEAEWLACTDPWQMQAFVRAGNRISARQLRLFACACCRRVWRHLVDERGREAVEAAEAFAEGKIRKAKLAAAEQLAEAAYYELLNELRQENPAASGEHSTPSAAAARQSAIEAACVASMANQEMVAQTSRLAAAAAGRVWRTPERKSELRHHADLLRDIASNYFRGVVIEAHWLSADVVALAKAAYENRTLPVGALEPERLSILADALEDAGCDAEALLTHLRSPGVHVRGCWAVDALLGRK